MVPRRRRPRARRPAWPLLLALMIGGLAGCRSEPREVQGLLLVTVDTLRADHVKAYGGPVPTPAFDRIAREGTLVEHAFTPTPTTGPAHASLFTGLHPWRHRVMNNAVPLREDYATLAEILSAAGFRTAAFISSYIVEGRFGFARGFDHFEFPATNDAVWRGAVHRSFFARGEATTVAARKWMAANLQADGAPFFVWVHYFDPHAPYQPPPEFRLPDDEPVALGSATVPEGVRSVEHLKQLIRRYRGEVQYVDAQLGGLIEQLDRQGLLDRTAVVVTADHGEGLGDHGVLNHGVDLFDELVRIPLLVRAPGVPRNCRLEGPVQLEDLLPSVLSALGVETPAGLDGRDMWPWLRGETAEPPRRAVVGRRKDYSGQDVLVYERSLDRKRIWALGGVGRVYDLALDPSELAPSADVAPPDWIRAMADEKASASRPPTRRDLDGEARDALEALGYLDATEPDSPR